MGLVRRIGALARWRLLLRPLRRGDLSGGLHQPRPIELVGRRAEFTFENWVARTSPPLDENGRQHRLDLKTIHSLTDAGSASSVVRPPQVRSARRRPDPQLTFLPTPPPTPTPPRVSIPGPAAAPPAAEPPLVFEAVRRPDPV